MQHSSEENPKLIRALKDGKAPLEYLILSVLEGDAQVHKGGADKYGIRNWLIDKIRASTYVAAILRHLFAWAAGQDLDPDSGYSHLYHIRACCAILLDSDMHATLIDDRNRCESINDLKYDAAKVAPGVFDSPAEAVTSDWGRFKSIYPPAEIAPEQAITGRWEFQTQYFVCFTDRGDFGKSTIILYKGPFDTIFHAEDYAANNPELIEGIKTIHTLNRP